MQRADKPFECQTVLLIYDWDSDAEAGFRSPRIIQNFKDVSCKLSLAGYYFLTVQFIIVIHNVLFIGFN